MNADPQKIVIFLQLRNSPQVCKSNSKTTMGVCTPIDLLLPDPYLLNRQLKL